MTFKLFKEPENHFLKFLKKNYNDDDLDTDEEVYYRSIRYSIEEIADDLKKF